MRGAMKEAHHKGRNMKAVTVAAQNRYKSPGFYLLKRYANHRRTNTNGFPVKCLADHVGKAAMEGTDLGLCASTRARVGRTSNVFLHGKGTRTFLAACREKVRHGTGIAAFYRKHGSRALAWHLRCPYLGHPLPLLDVFILVQGASHAESSARSLEQIAVAKSFSSLSENQ
jgi:hypothetical protein